MMTQPTTVFFGPDRPLFDGKNKVYLRTLLYSSAKRGSVIESLHVTVQRNESRQNFNVWVYGEKGDLKRGSGLFVPQEGITCNHHFLLPNDGSDFRFIAGAYKVTLFAKLVDAKAPRQIREISLVVSDAHAFEVSKSRAGIYFEWGADQQAYHAHVVTRLDQEDDVKQLLQSCKEMLAAGEDDKS